MNYPMVEERLELIVKQFLCNVPLNSFQWNNIFSDLILDEDSQRVLLDNTVNSKLVIDLPIAINYQKSFLKHIITSLEKCQFRTESAEKETVICDELYSAYGRLVSLAVQTDNFKHYLIRDKAKVVSLKESSNLISNGTTGLRTWQAAFVLSEWILNHESSFKNETLIELGSGIGLIGLILKECSLKKIYLTDCHAVVLDNLCQNLRLNISNHNINTEPSGKPDSDGRCLYHYDSSPSIHVLRLPWEEINEDECHKLGQIDSIIAADIVYDGDLFVVLVNALKCLVQNCCVKRVIISCTERNPDTLKSFLNHMNSASFSVEELKIPEQTNFIWPTDTPVRLFSFKMS